SIPPVHCSMQRVNGTVPPTNCSVPRLNRQAAAMTYRTVPVAMQEDYARRCYMRGYWTSPSYPQQQSASGAAYTGPCCMGPTSVYTDPKASNQGMQHGGVARTGQQQKFSTRYAPYPKETPAQSNGSCSMPPLFSANRTACDVDTAAVKDAGRYYSMMQADTWAAQSESTKRLAEKIWRRRIETQSYLDELNVHRRMSSCVVAQQILDEELVRCYSGSVERSATMQTHLDGRRMCPPFVSTSPPMTACAQVNAGQNAYYPLCVNITPSEPSTTHAQQNMGQNTYSVLCENISPPLPGACGNLWASSYRQQKGETLPMTNSGQSATYLWYFANVDLCSAYLWYFINDLCAAYTWYHINNNLCAAYAWYSINNDLCAAYVWYSINNNLYAAYMWHFVNNDLCAAYVSHFINNDLCAAYSWHIP
ncbi:hypothetical protein LSAT2_029011, partial [Lamellibrachia satsuma]